MKRGVSVQFNWMFVLIVGGLLLILIFSFLLRVKDSVVEGENREMLEELALRLVEAQVSPNTEKMISGGEVQVQCDAIRSGTVSTPLPSQIVFGPSRLSGHRFVVTAHPAEMPFFVENLVYLTSPRVLYVVVRNHPDEQVVEGVVDLFPEGATVQVEEAIPFSVEKFDAVRIISFQPISSLAPELMQLRSSLSAVYVDWEQQEVEFYSNRGGSLIGNQFSDVVDEESLLAALMSDTKQGYVCGMQRLWQRAAIAGELVRQRSAVLKDEYISSNVLCAGLHDDAFSILTDWVAAAALFSPDNVVNLMANAELLEQKNLFAQRNSCAGVY